MAEEASHPDEVHLVVGGYHYYLNTEDVLRHPSSYFAHMLKDEWTKDKTTEMTLDRNGKVFRHVSYYLYTGYMDTHRHTILDLDVLLTLRTEADFYGLPELARMCEDRIKYNVDRIIFGQDNWGLDCDCFQTNGEKATDALVVAMNIFRPPTVATSRVETYADDNIEIYETVSALLKRERENKYSSMCECSFAHNCFQMNVYNLKVNSQIGDAFSNWPISAGKQKVRSFQMHQYAYIYVPDGYCTSHVPTSASNGYSHGTFLYIFNSEHTGGRITTKVNGEEVSIEKPGECMALLPGCSYSVETVTSGHLVLFEYHAKLYACQDTEESESKIKVPTSGSDAMNCDVDEDVKGGALTSDGVSKNQAVTTSGAGGGIDYNKNPLVWQVRDSYSTEITAERSAALTQAINTAHKIYAGVVICLSTYYPAGLSTNNNRRCETDPALLKKFDADLYEHLGTFYEVTVVTVAVDAGGGGEEDDEEEQENDDVRDEGEEGEEEGDQEEEYSGHTARVLDFPYDADMKLKVVAPMQSVSLDRGSGNTMLLTGLLCFARGEL